MVKTPLQRIVEIVCHRAHKQGFVTPQEVRAVLADAGLPEGQWVDVVSLAGDMLSSHDGRIYYCRPARDGEQRRQRRLSRAVRQLMRGYKASGQDERRRQGRLDFIRPIRVDTEDGRTFMLLSCDLSTSGIRLVAPFSLLGKRIRITLPDADGARDRCFYARVVWASLVGDGLYENGAAFLGVAAPADNDSPRLGPPPLPIEFGGAIVATLPPCPVLGFVGVGAFPRPR